MLEMAVIADDLTGAADTGIQFRPLFAETLLLSDRSLATRDFGANAEALAIHTRTRALAPDAARARVAEAAGSLMAWAPRRVYKKVDSCLRGNIGAEIDALLEKLGFALSFVAPAFPEVGRTTAQDVHLLHGTPVAETEMRHDPATPVTESRLSQAIAARSRLPVDRVDLDIVEQGPDRIAEEVERLAAGGTRHITFDSTRQEHLKAIAGLSLTRFPSTLLVGSAGLGQGLRDCLRGDGVDESSQPPPAPSGHHLVAIGTATALARRQVAVLAKASGSDVLDLPADALATGEADPGWNNALAQAAAIFQKGDLVVRIEPPGGQPSAETALRVASGFGAFVAALVRRVRPASLFLSGGDTALGTLDALGTRAIRLEGEVLPGLVRGTLVGGDMEGLAVGTKSGAFGKDDAILIWRNSWSQRENGHA